MRTVMKHALNLLMIAAVSGCGPRAVPSDDAAPPSTGFVTVVGDATASTVVEQLDKNGIRTSTTLDDQADSSLLIVVQDSTVGPMPVHLELSKILGERHGSEYLWIFTNTSMVDDQELLELEELECRDIFNGVGLPGDDVPFAFDSAGAPVASDYECPKGWSAIVEHIRSIVE